MNSYERCRSITSKFYSPWVSGRIGNLGTLFPWLRGMVLLLGLAKAQCRVSEYESVTIARLPGRQHRYVYAAAAPVPGVNSPQQALVRVDTASGRVATWHAGAHTYVGEPVLVPKVQRHVGGARLLPT